MRRNMIGLGTDHAAVIVMMKIVKIITKIDNNDDEKTDNWM